MQIQMYWRNYNSGSMDGVNGVGVQGLKRLNLEWVMSLLFRSFFVHHVNDRCVGLGQLGDIGVRIIDEGIQKCIKR